MDIIKFAGKDKKEAIRKALAFFYDNFNEEDMTCAIFLSKCRIQNDKKTIHFYPKLPDASKKKGS